MPLWLLVTGGVLVLYCVVRCGAVAERRWLDAGRRSGPACGRAAEGPDGTQRLNQGAERGGGGG